MTDILERLRRVRCAENSGCNTLPECACVLMDEAAAEIERLRTMLDPITGATMWWDMSEGDPWKSPEEVYEAEAPVGDAIVPISCGATLGTVYAAKVVLTRDEDGDPVETEVRLFRTREEAEAALQIR